MKQPIERRKEERPPARGTVTLILGDQPETHLSASLLDMSRDGFRASHGYPQLSAGAELEFVHRQARGRARVIWTRILGETAESGFLILERAGKEAPAHKKKRG